MNDLILHPIGTVAVRDGEASLLLNKDCIPALEGLDGFSCLQILWWFDGCDNPSSRAKRTERNPYKKGPAFLGTFATRSPERPNPIALSCAFLTHLDKENGVVHLAYLDAEDGSPVLDIKPYTPSLDRVERPGVPDWCGHWPDSVEHSGEFDWAAEFNF